jgi:hypothetical protein
LDWSRIQLTASSVGGKQDINLNLLWFSTTVVVGRRRRYIPHEDPPSPVSSVLSRAIQHTQKRQISTGGTYYNLPSSTSFYLPTSCCKAGAVSNGNSLGGCE